MAHTSSLIEYFEAIRDIPYSIPLSISEMDHCCSGKHRRLKAQFEQTGIQTKWQVCRFKWSDMNLPEEVASVPHADDSTHVFLKVRIGSEWIDVDATWDLGIAINGQFYKAFNEWLVGVRKS